MRQDGPKTKPPDDVRRTPRLTGLGSSGNAGGRAVSTFAVIDAGSSAIRMQIAAVDTPGVYYVRAQYRQPVRLGHRVFETGVLDEHIRQRALNVLRQFKRKSEDHGVAAIRAVATSAIREAGDSADFLAEAAALGLPLEILAETEERD